MLTGFPAVLLAPLIAGIVSFASMLLLRRTRGLPLDRPNERSLHMTPVPRTGGIAMILGIATPAIFLQTEPSLVAPAIALAGVSYIDDRLALPALARLALHLFAAGVFLGMVGLSDPPMFIFLVFAIAWLTNLYNFMDGADGLAGGMTVIGFGTLAVAAGVTGAGPLAWLSGSISSAAAAFLLFNFPPAKVFMGDVGSIPLGFLAGAIGVAGWQQEVWPLWFPVVVFSTFVVDATVTLLRRVLRGERVWQAHREHYYQRLILSGWSHRRTALSEYALMVLSCAVALACLTASGPIIAGALLLLALVMAISMWAVDQRWRRFSMRKG